MKLPVNLQISTFTHLFKKNLSLILLTFVVLIVILVGFVIYGEFKKFSLTQSESAITGRIVKLNLDSHRALEKQLNDNITFEPKTIEGTEAFTTPPTIKQ